MTDGLDALYRFIYFRIGADSAAAEDVLQETARIALAHDAAPDGADDQEGWLRGIARNLIRRHWRTARRSVESIDAVNGGNSHPQVADVHRPDAAAIQRETMDRLMFAVSALPSEDQRILYAFYKHGRTRAQIAESLGVTEKSVQSRLYRLRTRLRERLESPEGIME